MIKLVFITALIISFIHPNLYAQYEIEYPLLLGDIYDVDGISVSNFKLPNPSESYKSIRQRTFSDGSFGLFHDDYTDPFRNPAFSLSKNSGEIYGDLGSVAENGKFFIGGFLPTGNGIIGLFTNLEGLINNKLTSDELSHSSSYMSTDNHSDIQTAKKYGARISYSYRYPSMPDMPFGISYQYMKIKNGSTSQRTSLSDYSTTTYKYFNLFDQSQNCDLHKIELGTMINMEYSTIDIRANGIFSSSKLNNLYLSEYQSSYSKSISRSIIPTDIKSKGGLIGGTIHLRDIGKLDSLSILLELGYTSFNLSGIDSYKDSSSSISFQNGTRDGKGDIIDIRTGCGIEKYFSQYIKGYVFFSFNYIHKKSETTAITDRSLSSGNPLDKNTSSPIEKRDDTDIRLPLGIEYFIGDYVTLRGGIEPGYRTGTKSIESIYRRYYEDYYASGINRIEQDRLSLSSNFGAGFKHPDYGELDILFGNVLTTASNWSISIRAFL
ncbi:MAG: hypothetical protein HY964_07110 [Ignavibacteriales bacterium]|nr:hypothetical protein [Ignavibacteriales bacterium]